ncbi:MAG: hypothetical protein JSU82_05605 [Rhodospirillales bacterium]|nr:MAG: hypothetical protein JSU82_05605 [Rhodospirillales bacterium]
MTEPLNREEIIALLKRLGEADDAAVLEAGRALHAMVTDADTGWDDLLVSQDGVETEAADTAAAPVPADPGSRDGEAMALIDKLLARPGITEDFRREMEGYRADIGDGDFTDSDLKYLRAVDKRLSGKG